MRLLSIRAVPPACDTGRVPEGDSVFKLARRLDRQLAGHTVVRSDFRTPALATRDLSGRQVLGHDTHGKHLLTRFGPTAGSPPATLHSHLRMDGSWSTLAPGKRYRIRVRVAFQRGTHSPPVSFTGFFRTCARPPAACRSAATEHHARVACAAMAVRRWRRPT